MFQHNGAYLKSVGGHVDFTLKETHISHGHFIIRPVSADRGLYKLINFDGKELLCAGGDKHEIGAGIPGDSRLKEFQFFPKDGGFVIYNPFAQRFVGPYGGDKAGCHDFEF